MIVVIQTLKRTFQAIVNRDLQTPSCPLGLATTRAITTQEIDEKQQDGGLQSHDRHIIWVAFDQVTSHLASYPLCVDAVSHQQKIAAHPAASILALRLLVLPIGASCHRLLAKVVHEHAVIATVGHEPPPVGAHAAEPHLGAAKAKEACDE